MRKLIFLALLGLAVAALPAEAQHGRFPGRTFIPPQAFIPPAALRYIPPALRLPAYGYNLAARLAAQRDLARQFAYQQAALSHSRLFAQRSYSYDLARLAAQQAAFARQRSFSYQSQASYYTAPAASYAAYSYAPPAAAIYPPVHAPCPAPVPVPAPLPCPAPAPAPVPDCYTIQGGAAYGAYPAAGFVRQRSVFRGAAAYGY